jgi:hypothetical protein
MAKTSYKSLYKLESEALIGILDNSRLLLVRKDFPALSDTNEMMMLISLLLFLLLPQTQALDCLSVNEGIKSDFQSLLCPNQRLQFLPPLKGLTPLWNQEYVGIDMANELMTSISESLEKNAIDVIEYGRDEKTLSKFQVSNFYSNRDPKKNDSANEYSKHSDGVLHLLFDDVLGSSSHSTLNFVETSNADDKTFAEGIRSIINSKGKIINISGATGRGEESLAAWRELIQKDKTVVVAIGNSYPSIEPGNRNIDKIPSVAVGSLDPFGLISPFSTEDRSVTILAPCDYYGYVQNSMDNNAFFSGTSCSTPHVSGTLANAVSILPSLTRDDLLLLLKKTAIPTFFQKNNPRQVNGAGMLNAYKLLRVVQRLKVLGFPKNKEALLNSDSLYNFLDEAEGILSKGSRPSKCIDPLAEANKMRKAFLLNPTAEIASSLSKKYLVLGQTINSFFYESLATKNNSTAYLEKILDSRIEENQDSNIGEIRSSADRVLIFTSRLERDHPFVQLMINRLTKQVESSSLPDRSETLKSAILLGPHGIQIVRSLTKDPEKSLREEAEKYLSFYESGMFTFSNMLN